VKDLSIEVLNLDEHNVDDALNVCTFQSVRNDKQILLGCEIRREWLLGLLRNIGPCAKIAYLDGKPVGTIQYTPLHLVPYFKTKRKDALYIHCMFVQEAHRKKGIGSALLDALICEMSKPNRLFRQARCKMLVASARRIYGYSQVGLFKHKGFRRVAGNVDVGLILPLSDLAKGIKLDIPRSRAKSLQEDGVKIFFKPTCQYCKRTNESLIKAEIRKVNPDLTIEECNMWTCPEEAIRRRITSVATYIRGNPVLPMSPDRFLKTIRNLASQKQS
jgi:GNAT superfamily N-acetyltransferase